MKLSAQCPAEKAVLLKQHSCTGLIPFPYPLVWSWDQGTCGGAWWGHTRGQVTCEGDRPVPGPDPHLHPPLPLPHSDADQPLFGASPPRSLPTQILRCCCSGIPSSGHSILQSGAGTPPVASLGLVKAKPALEILGSPETGVAISLGGRQRLGTQQTPFSLVCDNSPRSRNTKLPQFREATKKGERSRGRCPGSPPMRILVKRNFSVFYLKLTYQSPRRGWIPR